MKKIIILALALILIISATNVFAVGVAGPNLKKTIVFEPNKEEVLKYVLRPSAGQTKDYQITITKLPESEFDITKHVQLEPSSFNQVKPEEKKVFQANIRLPNKINIPGLHGAKVCVLEKNNVEAMVNIETSACAQLFVAVGGVQEEVKEEQAIESEEQPKEESVSAISKKSAKRASGAAVFEKEQTPAKKIISEEEVDSLDEGPVSKRIIVRIAALLAALLCVGVLVKGMYSRFR